MNTHEISPITERQATEAGALDGFEARCTCGLELRSSLRTLLEADIAAHAAWHERQAVLEQVARELADEGPEPHDEDGNEIAA